VNGERRALAFTEISSQINVLNLKYRVQKIDPDSNTPIIKLLPINSPENLATLVRSLNLNQKTFLTNFLHNGRRNASFYEFVGGGACASKSRL